MSFTTDATGVNPATLGNVDTPTPTPATSTQKFYTEEDLQRVREQEKDKLYKRLETLEQSLVSTQTTLSAAERLAKEKADAVAEEERKRMDILASEEKEKLTLREQLKLEASERQKMKEDFDRQLREEAHKRETQDAIQAKERQFLEFNAFKAQRVSEEKDNIAPQLLGLVSGSSPEELEASISKLKETSAAILEAVQKEIQQARQNTPGTRVTSPGTGLPDTNTGQNTDLQDIASMSMVDYAKNRHKFIGNTANGTGGLFR